MAPVWLCLKCEGLAYGWSEGPCIHCGSPHVIGTEESQWQTDITARYDLLLIPAKAWEKLLAEAGAADRSPAELLAEREDAVVVSVRIDPVSNGRLVLLDTEYKTEERYQRD